MNESRKYARKVSPEETGSFKSLRGRETDYLFRCVGGLHEGQQFRLNDLGNSFTVGRSSECSLNIQDDQLEEKHFLVNKVPETVFYIIEDLTNKGFWKKLSNIDPFTELKQSRTEFKIDEHSFCIFEQEGKFFLDVSGCSLSSCALDLKDGQIELEDDDFELSIGKKDCLINLELKRIEPIKMLIVREEGRILVRDETEDISFSGFFVKIFGEMAFRAGDVLVLGSNTFCCHSFNWGVTIDIGDKPLQEDKFAILDDLRIFDDLVIPFFGVYDGHGGPCCSLFLSRRFHTNLLYFLKQAHLEQSNSFIWDLGKVVTDTIIFTDFQFKEEESDLAGKHGSTLVFILILGNKVFSANLGDSVAMLSRGEKIIHLTKDFKPERQNELKRIEYRKAYVQSDRVLGVIMVSRSLGDWNFKHPEQYTKYKDKVTDDYVISNRAECRVYDIEKEDDYLLVASDGIYPQIDDEKLFELVNKYSVDELSNGLPSMPLVADNVRLDITNSSLTTTKKKVKADNMTMIVIDVREHK